MRKKQLFALLAVFFTTMMRCDAFLYPVDFIDAENILVMHQASSENLELLVWNPYTNLATKELTSFYIPAQLQLLPGKKSYSFIDRGRIRIKSFEKRAPKTIDIFEPICDIQSMHWINDDQFYFVAKYKSRYKVFMYDSNHLGGSLYALTNIHDEVNYIFPSKIDDHLFCITQSEAGPYKFSKIEFAPITYLQAKDADDAFGQAEILAESSYPLCFLSMQSKDNGFIIEMTEKNLELKTFSFQCCILSKSQDCWTMKRLFEFMVPEYLIMGLDENRLYESIYPLLPKYFKDKIYFSSFNFSRQTCLLYEYDIVSRQTQSCYRNRSIDNEKRHFFAPMMVADKRYLGCSFDPSKKHRSALQVNETNGTIECHLPTF